ncbi:MAG: FHA domain-containing protein [Phycisphaerales bacterium]
MNVVLIAFRSSGERRDFRVAGSPYTIGRKPDCNLRIPSAAVSRKHCELTIDGDALKVRDLGSSNGTFLNDVRVQAASLAAGDRLTVGNITFTVQINGQPASVTPPAPSPHAQRATSSDESSMMEGVSSSHITDPDDSSLPPPPQPPKPQPQPTKPDDATPPADPDDPLSSMISRADDSDEFDFDFLADEPDDKA